MPYLTLESTTVNIKINIVNKCRNGINYIGKKSIRKEKTYRLTNRVRDNKSKLRYSDKLRAQLFDLLGGPVCKKCKFNDKRALHFAHKNDDGNLDRKRFKTVTVMAIYYLKHQDECKDKLEILCANCNVIQEAVRRWVPRD